MATKTITALVALSAASRQQDDVLAIVDVHDFTQAPAGSTKKITVANLFTNVAITGTISATGLATVNQLQTTVNAGIGGAPTSNVGLRVLGSPVATVSQTGIMSNVTYSSAATTNGIGFLVSGATAPAVFTLANAYGLLVNNTTKGAGSAITNQYGVYVESQTSGVTNYAIRTNLGLVRFGDDVTLDMGLTVTGATVLGDASFAGAAGSVVFGSQVLGSSLIPGTTALYNIGTTTFRWQDLWLSRNLTAGATITAAAFAGPLTGNVTGNVSGSAATVTGATQAAITTLSNLVTVGALNAGSITSGFGNIDVGANSITGDDLVANNSLSAGTFFPISGGTVFRDSGDANDNFRIFDSTGAVTARGVMTAPSALLSGDTVRGHIYFSASATPATPLNGMLWWDGTNLRLRSAGVSRTIALA